MLVVDGRVSHVLEQIKQHNKLSMAYVVVHLNGTAAHLRGPIDWVRGDLECACMVVQMCMRLSGKGLKHHSRLSNKISMAVCASTASLCCLPCTQSTCMHAQMRNVRCMGSTTARLTTHDGVFGVFCPNGE